MVLFFFRSADWCPYCQAQLIDVNGGIAEIEKRGYRVAGLSYDNPEILQAFTAKRVVMMDGMDIVEALRRRISLDDVVAAKFRIAVEERRPFVHVRELFP